MSALRPWGPAARLAFQGLGICISSKLAGAAAAAQSPALHEAVAEMGYQLSLQGRAAGEALVKVVTAETSHRHHPCW